MYAPRPKSWTNCADREYCDCPVGRLDSWLRQAVPSLIVRGMAKDENASGGKRETKRPATRKYLLRDEGLLSPIFVDHSTLAVGTDVVIHSMFQTQIPLEGSAEREPSESLLVGRFVYPANYLKALAIMLARQYIQLEVEKGKDKAEEALNWFSKELTKQAAKGGIEPSKASR